MTETGRQDLTVEVDPRGESDPLTIFVQLPPAAQTTWAADVVVVNSQREPMAACHVGIEWHKFTFTVPPEHGMYTLQVIESKESRPKFFGEPDRVSKAAGGVTASVAQWPGDRKAALSIRFDDSHPTHVSHVMPRLHELSVCGTFMVNPGRSGFQNYLQQWKSCALRGDQELANHTMNHRGANNDKEAEQEIGDAANAIRALAPRQNRLMALNLGGGTTWETTRSLRYYLDKFRLFDASSGSLGMDDVYGDRPAAFRQHLQRHIDKRGWCRIHFHAIGDGLNSSDATLESVLSIVQERTADLWVVGMTAAYKYFTERRAAKIDLQMTSQGRYRLELTCTTDLKLYDQPLTMKLEMPSGTSASITGPGGNPIDSSADSESSSLLFEVPAVDAVYLVELNT